MRQELLSREEAVNRLSTTEGLQEITFEFGGDEPTFSHHETGDSVGLLLGNDEYELSEPAFTKVCRLVGIAETLLGKFPRALLVPLLNHWFSQRRGDMKCLLDRDDLVVAFTKTGVVYVPGVQLLEAVEHALTAKFGNGPFGYHHVFNDLTETQLAVVTPRSTFDVKPGDAVNFGIQLQTSVLGEKPVVISAYVYRLACANGAISCDNVFTFSRRIRSTTMPAWVEDVCLMAADKAQDEFDRLRALANTKIKHHGGHIIQGLFREFALPKDTREMIATRLVDEGADSLYDVYNAITSTANTSDMTPVQIRHLQQAAGLLAKNHDFCPTCHRTLPEGSN